MHGIIITPDHLEGDMSVDLAKVRKGRRFRIVTSVGGVIVLRFVRLVDSRWPHGGKDIVAILEQISVSGFTLGAEVYLMIAELDPNTRRECIEQAMVMGSSCITSVPPGNHGLISQPVGGAERVLKIAKLELL